MNDVRTGAEDGQRARTVRVMVVDDHPLARRGVSRLVSRDPRFEVCAEADDVDSALKRFSEVRPDVLVVDITLKNGSGIELIQKLREHEPEVKVVVLSMHDESLYAEEALRAGEKIVEALKRVLDGGVYLDPRFADQIVRRLAQPSKSAGQSPVESLSERESEVFHMHGQGLSVREIAAELGLSPKTVETYRENIKMKLNLRSSNELVRYAVQWMQDHDPAAKAKPDFEGRG
jgi:DNA-binding NarL/FixJ family response regulator